MKLLAFFKSPAGNLVLFAAFLGVGGLMLYRGHQRDQAQAQAMTPVANPDAGVLHASIARAAAVFKPAPPPPVAKPAPKPEAVVARPVEANATPERAIRARPSEPPKPRLPPLSLVAVAKPAAEESELSKNYAPFGRLIPCETVITLESSKLDTPVIGLVTEDVWHNGRRIIPAGAEVHGRAALDRSRERLAASGKWIVVWRDGSGLNGTELALNGIALERAKDEATGEFGFRDGSAGLVGDLLRESSRGRPNGPARVGTPFL